MNKRLIIIALLAFCLSIDDEQINAQIQYRAGFTTGLGFFTQSFSPELFTSNNPQTFRTGLILGGMVEISFEENLSLHIEPKYIQRGTKFQHITTTTANATPNGFTDATFKTDYFELPVLLKLTSTSVDMKPFGFVGPALSFITRARIDAPGTNILNRPNSGSLDISQDTHSTDILLEIGGGIELPINPTTALIFDLRYSHGMIDIYENPALPSAKSNGITLLAGLFFDLFPYESGFSSATSYGYSHSLQLDSDGDGLSDYDEVNKCKTNPYQTDTDGDSLTDGDEILVYKTNPLDPDTDHGGIKDGPEISRGTLPLNAADDIPRKEEFKVEVGKSIVLEGIVFKTGSAEISPNSAAILEKAFNTLQQNQDIVVEIHGHTDNVGKHAYNMKLSLSRANAIKQYLVQQGIDVKRISTRGFAFDKPLAPNNTPEGKQKNRRIEFYRVR